MSLVLQTRKGPSSWAVVSGWKRYLNGDDDDERSTPEDADEEHNNEKLKERQILSFSRDGINSESKERVVTLTESDSPINNETVRRELNEFRLGYYRNLVNETSGRRNAVNEVAADNTNRDGAELSSSSSSSSPLHHGRSSHAEVGSIPVATMFGSGSAVAGGTFFPASNNQYETHPDLRIPVNGEFLHLAQ